ncbi:bifunctional methylenetetrahydrofolate dehydrogenase/methenyltetrahydrofolate cyclohydrolase FolD [Ichthyobacterium seriolicida]|uniref:Bifunctional protein FolD n=1 Tax=Ichthyobacterium seriolicida TaxID=242600 RepID=A0A1J1DYE9_9FLAO|nr:bifunctional methylenetetrahydrofolate dehydrogenase/methenyltetrahydrofolate cyclohydrolase FolD [Ichthyobacterium seriolicida]BAV94919.1 bifunctional methylenetetrahydrofolate dehydrogenase/methenyltetrahydrofolate cyclohydrolase FolD [Ichthyobacterium seriolicida]
MKILDGKTLSVQLKKEISIEVQRLIERGNRRPHLVVVLVGDHAPSQVYVNAKVKACDQVGFDSTLIRLSESISESDLLDKIQDLNKDPNVDGFIIQLPLPKHIDFNRVTLSVDPKKDVDGFHPENIGKMVLGLDTYLPATPFGIIELLKRNNIETRGKHAVVIGRSTIVGTPVSLLLSRKGETGNCTVTLAHSHTVDLKSISLQADIIIVALGIPNFLTSDMVKEGAVVIDVGINRVEDATKKRGFALVGDVDFKEVSKKASHITPVPGGVGPMTIAMLLKNTLIAREFSLTKSST